MTHPHLEGLIRKWRKKSENAKREADWSRESASFHDERDMLSRSETYNTCADELEAALAALPGGGVDAKPEPEAGEPLDFTKPMETCRNNPQPVRWVCQDVVEIGLARVCVDQRTGIVYSSPYHGMRVRNVALPTPPPHEADRNG